MGQKEQIAGSYISEMKKEHLKNPNPPSSRRSLILGWEKGNIADGIKDALQDAGHNSFAMSQKSCNAADRIRMAEVVFTVKPDTLVLANGFSRLDWVEDISRSEEH